MAGLGLKVGRACVDFLLASCKAGGSSRPCLVYVPGLSSVRRSQKSEAFKALALEELGFNYITLDLTGHGDASGTLQELTPAKAIADLTNVLQYFAGENSRYYLVGASFGWCCLFHIYIYICQCIFNWILNKNSCKYRNRCNGGCMDDGRDSSTWRDKQYPCGRFGDAFSGIRVEGTLISR